MDRGVHLNPNIEFVVSAAFNPESGAALSEVLAVDTENFLLCINLDCLQHVRDKQFAQAFTS